MTLSHDRTPNRQLADTPNRQLADDLERVAHWLRQHPELPASPFASVHIGDSWHNGRAEMTTVAEALPNPTEHIDDIGGGYLQIRGEFGRVRIIADARVERVGGQPSKVVVEPILPIVSTHADEPEEASATPW